MKIFFTVLITISMLVMLVAGLTELRRNRDDLKTKFIMITAIAMCVFMTLFVWLAV